MEATTAHEVVELIRVARREERQTRTRTGEVRLLRNITDECHVGGVVRTWRCVTGSASRAEPSTLRCALNTGEGASDVVEDRFEIEVIGEGGEPRRGAAHLMDFLPKPT